MSPAYSVVVPSAVLVPEAMRAVGNLPAVVYPLSEGTFFDALWTQYSDASEIVIVACRGAKEVRKRIDLATHPTVSIVEMPEVGDLCSTVRFGLDALESKGLPAIVNFSDTIAHGVILDTIDSFYSSRERLSEEWTFFERSGDCLRVTYDRDEAASAEPGYGDAFVGVFRFDDPRAMLDGIDATAGITPDGDTSWFYRALEHYGERHQLTPIEPADWFDIGHPSGYVSAQLQVKAREFNHISIDRNRAILRKSSDDVDKFLGEIRWYLKLPADVSYAAPRIFGYSLAYDGPWVEMEYYPYHTLHSLWLNGRLDRAQWATIFERIAFVLEDFARYRVSDDPVKVSAALREMYLDKTVQRLERLRGKEAFAPLFDGDVTVNGERYPSLTRVEELLRDALPGALCSGDADICLVHGDLCFANVMVDDSLSFVKLVDPRGKFGPFDIYGDQRYELAKLAHSVDGLYDLIIKEQFDLAYDRGARDIEFNVARPEGPDLYEIMQECLAPIIGDRIHEVELIEATLFLSMVPLHGESERQQLAMLGTGLELLKRTLKEM